MRIDKGCVDECKDVWMDERMCRWMKGCVDG